MTGLLYVHYSSWKHDGANPQVVEIFYMDNQPLKLVWTHAGKEKQQTETYYFAENGCGIPKKKRKGHQLSRPFFEEMARSYQVAFTDKIARK